MATQNLLLARFPADARERLSRRVERVELFKGQCLLDVGETMPHAYFPVEGLIGLEILAADGHVLELAAIGHEGMIGLPIVLRDEAPTYRAIVQVAGAAHRLRATVLGDELRQNSATQKLLLEYSASVVRQITQAVLCHHAHTVLERVCRWLLTAADRLGAETIHVTQDRIAQALGTDRSAVSRAAVELEDADAVRMRRGRITLRKRAMLEATACECYGALRGALLAERDSASLKSGKQSGSPSACEQVTSRHAGHR
jgi:CRP-like cAMP-binding protein